MALQPCTQCRRHVLADQRICPFCAAPMPADQPTRALRAGRFARAAVFAGASLAACDQGKLPEKPISNEATAHAPRIVGVVTDQNGVRLPQTAVGLSGVGHNIQNTTDDHGHYVFDELQPGTYSLSFTFYGSSPVGQREGSFTKEVVVGSEKRDQEVDVKLDVHDVPVAMPYGAPPARGRFV